MINMPRQSSLFMALPAIPIQITIYGISITTILQILISAGLLGLYFFMYRTQQRQADIQETQNQIMSWQTQLMAAQHQPEVRVDDSHAEGNQAHVQLSNLGEGRANNLRIKCLLYYRKGQEYSTAFSNQVLGFVITPKESALKRLGKTQEFVGGDGAINTKTETIYIGTPLPPKKTE